MQENLSPNTVADITQLVRVLGPALIVFIVVVLAVVVITVVALFAKSGIKIGNFRAGLRKHASTDLLPQCAPVMAEHTAVLQDIGATLKRLELHLEDQDQMLIGHGSILSIVLDQFEGKEINGQVATARRMFNENKAYHDALQKVLAKGVTT